MSFLSLPNELKFQILSYINMDINDPTTHNTRHALRQVHPWFRSQISKLDLREQVLVAEAADTIPRGDLVCHTCFRILPEDLFRMVRIPYDSYYYSPGHGFYTLIKPKLECPGCRESLMKESKKETKDRGIKKLLLGNREKKP